MVRTSSQDVKIKNNVSFESAGIQPIRLYFLFSQNITDMWCETRSEVSIYLSFWGVADFSTKKWKYLLSMHNCSILKIREDRGGFHW